MGKVEDSSDSSILSRLIKADGFDTGFGSINEHAWKKYSEYIKYKLNNIKENDSIYDVGCGAGAFLYNFINITRKSWRDRLLKKSDRNCKKIYAIW